MAEASIGIIGGSGLYALAAQSELEEVVLDTPFGCPSGPYRIFGSQFPWLHIRTTLPSASTSRA